MCNHSLAILKPTFELYPINVSLYVLLLSNLVTVANLASNKDHVIVFTRICQAQQSCFLNVFIYPEDIYETCTVRFFCLLLQGWIDNFNGPSGIFIAVSTS